MDGTGWIKVCAERYGGRMDGTGWSKMVRDTGRRMDGTGESKVCGERYGEKDEWKRME